MNEIEYKRTVAEALAYHGWEVQEHEDRHKSFVPDLSFSANGTDGWIEVKYSDEEPHGLNSIDHWTRGQEQWLFDRGRVGSGNCFLLVGTQQSHVLWRFDVLPMCRYQSWVGAVQYAFIATTHIGDLTATMNRRVTQRGWRG